MPDELDAIIEAEAADLRKWLLLADVAVSIFKVEPTEEFLASMKATLDDLQPWIALTQNENLGKGNAYLLNFFEHLAEAPDKEAFIEQLWVNFASMFYGIGEQPVFLVESVHRGTEHSLYEKPYFEVESIFAEWRFTGLIGFNEPYDHLCNELAFLEYLVDGAADCMARGDLAQYRILMIAGVTFVDEHLSQWAPGVVKGVLSNQCSEYFKGGARLVSGLQEELVAYVSGETNFAELEVQPTEGQEA